MAAILRGGIKKMYWTRLTLIVFVAGCVSAKDMSRPSDDPKVGLEQWLRSSVENGHEGVDEIIRTAHVLYNVPLETGLSLLTNTAAPITLADGTVISEVTTNATGSGIGMTVAKQPCFSVEKAVALTGARKMSDGPHGASSYDAYVSSSQVVSIDFSAAEPGRNCVSSLYISKTFLQEAP